MKVIKNWDDLIGMRNDSYWLDINADIGCGWVRKVENNETVAYLSTHTFYEKKCDFSTEYLRSFGFNVTLEPWR
jgi:hypothetical protein